MTSLRHAEDGATILRGGRTSVPQRLGTKSQTHHLDHDEREIAPVVERSGPFTYRGFQPGQRHASPSGTLFEGILPTESPTQPSITGKGDTFCSAGTFLKGFVQQHCRALDWDSPAMTPIVVWRTKFTKEAKSYLLNG